MKLSAEQLKAFDEQGYVFFPNCFSEDEIASSVKRQLTAALERAEESPQPDPSTLTQGVFASPEDLDTPHHK